MKQLYYTSCRSGKSVSGSRGFQVRAVSPDIPADQIRAAVRYVGYSLPDTVAPSDDTAAEAPVRLALLETPDVGRVLCHGVYVGRDPTTNRFGNFFSHMLLDLPPDIDATAAIQTWGSEFWRCADDDGDTQLPTVSQLPTASLLDDAVLAAFLAHPANRQTMHFMLQALLVSKPDTRIFVAAHAEHVAACVFGITRVLPRGMLEEITFSTYESDPLTCHARLVATSWGDAQEMELPSSCFSGGCVAYNSVTGKQTTLTEPSHFADFAIKRLSDADDDQKTGSLRKFLRLCNRVGITHGEDLETFYRCCRKDAVDLVSREDTLRLLGESDAAAAALKRSPALLDHIVSLVSRDREYYESAVPKLVAVLSKNSQMLERSTGASPDTRRHLRAWVLLDGFVKSPRIDAGYLGRVAEALELQPQAVKRKALVQAEMGLAGALYDSAKLRDIKTDLRTLLMTLGPFFNGGKKGLYDALVKRYGGGVMYWREANLSCGLAAVACSDEFAGIIGRDQLVQVVKQIKTRGGKSVFAMVKKRSKRWSKASRRRWARASRSIWPWIIWSTITLFAVLTLLLALDKFFLHKLNVLERFIPPG